MEIIIHSPKYQNFKPTPKVKFKYPKNFLDIIISQQSLPTKKSSKSYYPIIDLSKKFEESIEKCRKKDKIKIKAIERTTISKNLSRNIIENYKKLEQNSYRNRCLSDSSDQNLGRNNRRASELVDQLLLDIYGRSTYSTPDIDQKFETEYCSSTSMRSLADRFDEKLQYSRLRSKNITELRILIETLKDRVNYTGIILVKQLKKKDALKSKQEKICNVITAHLQAFSDRKCEDTTMRFSPNPTPGDCGFNQWRDAMKMVAKLPGGIPPEFRKKLWLSLAEKHLQSKGVNWSQTEKLCFNEWSNPDDSELGIQIVKDLHRTGCSLFCGAAGQENQALLKRVLLAYARWNKSVGYCQGFNMLAALILQVMDKSETDSVKVMIYLIEGVLPESYFANNLRGLSVDMIVFRDLLKIRLPLLSKHLEALQNDAREGNSYEPPLTNVFTMQWFLTLFCNCLPQATVLRVWDLIFLEGNEILLRTAIAIWEKLSDRILAVNSADEFYSIMGVLTREMLEFGLVDSNTLIKSIVAIGTCSELNDMRDRYLYNITPWTQSVQTAAKKGFKLFYSDEDEAESDYDEKAAVTAAYGISIGRKREKSQLNKDGTTIQPYTHHPDRERLALDISALKKQYAKLRERQRQAHIILQAACARQPMGQPNSPGPITMNHLLLGKNAIVNSRGRRLGPPKGSIPPARIKEPLKKKDQAIPCETIHWKDTEQYKRRQSYTEETLASEETFEADTDSSSYSDGDQSSTSTELCDEPGRLSDFDSDEKVSELESKKNEEHQEMKKEDMEKVEEIKSDINELISDIISDSKNNLVSLSSKEEITTNFNFVDALNKNEEYLLNVSSETTPTNITNADFLQFDSFLHEDLPTVYNMKKEENMPNTTKEETVQSFPNISSYSAHNTEDKKEEIYTSFFSNFKESCLQKQDTDVSTYTSYFPSSVLSPENSYFKIKDTTISSQNQKEIYKPFVSSSILSPEDTYFKIEDTDVSLNFNKYIATSQNKEEIYKTLISSSILSPEDTCFKNISSHFICSSTLSPEEIESNTNFQNEATNSVDTKKRYKSYEDNISSTKIEEMKTPEEIQKEEEIFESFFQERVKILKENSSESLTSPKEEQNRSSELRRHKSYEETSKNNTKRIFKQQSFDINVVPIIEASLWKPYQIDEESPKEEIEERKDFKKPTLVDLLTVEDKRLEQGRKNSERALKIIQENSMILHRILQQQKSSEKEDSEDELSRSPISRTFLRSESLLSKDEKTDEERSSKDGDEDLESGLESFSVSPALMEEEIDLKNEDTLTSCKYTSEDFSNFVSSIESKVVSPISSILVKTFEEYSPIMSEEKTIYDVASSILDTCSSASNDIKFTVDKVEEYTYSAYKFKENNDNSNEDKKNEDTYDSNTEKDLSSFMIDSKFEDSDNKYFKKDDYNIEDFSLTKYKYEESDEDLKRYTKPFEEESSIYLNKKLSSFKDLDLKNEDISETSSFPADNKSPPKNLSCLQFTSFQTEIPCSSKFPPICTKEKQISPEMLSPVKSPKYLINLPTLSPPRRSLKSPLSPNRTFSPFPVQPTTRQPKELGVKLGIYKDLSPLKSPTNK